MTSGYRAIAKPDFDRRIAAVNVDVGRLVGFVTVEVEAIRATAKNRWHYSAASSITLSGGGMLWPSRVRISAAHSTTLVPGP